MSIHPIDLVAALTYVQAHPGVATAQFVHDHAPIGNTLWAGLFYADYLVLHPDGGLCVTDAGRGYLAAAAEAMA